MIGTRRTAGAEKPTAQISPERRVVARPDSLWEAFVAGDAKGATHVEDTEAAVRRFSKALPNLPSANAVQPSAAVYSLIGAALLRTGWSSDIAVLEESCLVIRATKAP